MARTDMRLVRIFRCAPGEHFHSAGYLVDVRLALVLRTGATTALESGEVVHVTVGCDPERLRAGRVIEASARHDMAAVLLDEPVAETVPLLRWGSLSNLTSRVGCEIRYRAGNRGPERQIQAYVEPVTAGGDRFYEVEPTSADFNGSDAIGGPVMAGMDLFCGLFSLVNSIPVARPVEGLLADTSFRSLLKRHLVSVPRLRPIPTATPATAFSVVLGVGLAVVAFFLNLFNGPLQTTALLAAGVAVSLLAWFFITSVQESRRLGPGQRHRWALVAFVSTGLAAGGAYWGSILLEGSAGYQTPVCLYQVSNDNKNGAFPVPLKPSGSVEQEFVINARTISSIFVIMGMDPALTDPAIPHAARVTLLSRSREVIDQRDVEKVENNSQTQFSFAEPIAVDSSETYYFRVTNLSNAPVSVYLKKVSPTDLVRDPDNGPVVVGQLDRADHREDGSAVSGCVLGIRAKA
jgi:hypothetical protein